MMCDLATLGNSSHTRRPKKRVPFLYLLRVQNVRKQNKQESEESEGKTD